MSAPDRVIRVVAAVVEDDGRFLVCRRPAHKRHGGLWEFPGGKCEPGETDADAVRRELLEELGVTTEATGEPLATIADPGSPYAIAFVPARIVAGAPVCHEHDALHWGTLDELAAMPLAPSDARFVTLRRRDSGGG